jgi:hypothetical protein
MHFAWSSPTTDVAVHYVYFATYYSHREGEQNDIDQSHDFTFDVSHEFSPRFRVNLAEEFRPGFEPSVDNGQTQRMGDHVENNLIISTAYSMGGRWELPVNFRHYFMRYADSEVANVQDWQLYSGSVGIRYNWTPQTRLGLLATHEVSAYEDVNRDRTADRFHFTVSHAFTPRLSVDADVGGEVSFFDQQGGAEINPNIRISANYALSPRTVLTGQFQARTLPTEVVQYMQQQSYNFMLGVSHQFTSRLTMGANVLYVPTEYDYKVHTDFSDLPSGTPPPPKSQQHEDIVSLGLNMSYQFNMHWRAEIGATHTSVSSDMVGRTYDRTIGYVQTRIGF